MIVIGLTGKQGAGKDSVADVLVEEHGFARMAFADPLKAMVRRLDPIIGHELYVGCCDECNDTEVTEVRMSDALKFGFDDNSLKESPWAEEVRDLWQRFGTDVMRAEDPDYWVRVAEADLWEVAAHADRVVFTDVRFENEAAMILYNGGHLWQVSRPGYDGDDHESEQFAGLLGEEVQIINDGELGDLDEGVQVALDVTLSGKIPGQMALFDLDELARELGLMEETND